MEKKFKIGDVVRLNSEDNLKMTVESMTDTDKGTVSVKCVYFVGGTLFTNKFNQDSLILA